MVSFLITIAAVVVIFPYIPGSDSAAFQGISVFLGLLFTLSSTAAVTNIVAGIIQTYTGAFRVGDLVKIGDVTGLVIEKRLLTTRVRTFKNEEASIPNGSVLNTNIINYTTLAKEDGLILHTTVTIGYDVPWQQVQDLLIKAALATPDVLHEPRPFVLQNSLGDFSVAYQLNCYTKAAERMPRVYSAIHQQIQDKFNEANVEILSPTFSALRDGNTVTTPPDYLPGDYEVPAFRVNAMTPQASGVPATEQASD
jgi:small-conductance mechanosensitive channel